MQEPTLLDRATGALLGAFVGDALGMPYEGRPGAEIPDRVEMIDGRAPAGTYTDDTQMMIALAESLIRCGKVDPDDLAGAFLNSYEPARGYGGGTEQVLGMWRAGVPVRDAAARLWDGEGSPNDGAAMRVAPVALALFEDELAVVRVAAASARITHAHPHGIDGAVVQAVAVAAALRGEGPVGRALAAVRTEAMRERLGALAAIAAAGDELDPRRLAGEDRQVGFTAVAAVPVAVVIGSAATNLEQAISVAVRCGGDTDTVAAMAGAVAGARFGASAIPPQWHEALEDGPRGRSHVERLAADLLRVAG